MANLAVPSPATTIPGQEVTGAFWNKQVRDAVNFLVTPPVFSAYQATTQPIASGSAGVTVSLDTTVVDSYGGWSPTNYAYTAQVAGFYLISGVMSFAAHSDTAQRLVQIHINGAVPAGGQSSSYAAGSSDLQIPTATLLTYLHVGDAVSLWGRQLSGVQINTAGGNTSALSIAWQHA